MMDRINPITRDKWPLRHSSATATEPALPAYVEYQGDGDVRAGLVYVNYGMQDDYKTLERLGVSVKGRIVIARYGSGWRGLKPKLAQDHGAIGCIIYSDPADDGYSVDETYPSGPMRPPQGLQRGSVLDMLLYPGDPLTPGVGATKNAKRLKISEARPILKIPVLPISYADAQVFPGRPNGEARLAADHLSRGARRCRCPSGRKVRLEPQTDLRCHRDHQGIERSRPVGGTW